MNYNLLIHSSPKITLLGIKYKHLSNLPNQVRLNFIFSHLWEFYNTFRELRQLTIFLETNFTACRNNSIYKLYYLFNYSWYDTKNQLTTFSNSGKKKIKVERCWLHHYCMYDILSQHITGSSNLTSHTAKKSILFFSLINKYFFLLTFFLFSFWFFFPFFSL